jgi:23S rRNA pseudouridine1911/1915/1917 synthase
VTAAPAFVVPDGNRRTLASLVHELFGLSHREAKELIESGGVTLDGRVAADPVRRPPGGARVEAPAGTAARGPRPRRERPIEGPGFRVIHLDADLVVVEKAPGVVTIPTGKPDANDPPLVARLLSALQVAGHRVPELHVVHRIDRDTSGLVVFTRSRAAAEALRAQFRARQPEREYVAWTEGVPHPASGRLHHLLREDPRSLRMLVAAPQARRPRDAKDAELTYETEVATGPPAPRARVRVRLVSGRRNQIRAQFGASGWPILGDRFYGATDDGPGRVALHAMRLAFLHPKSREPMTFESPWPADLAKLDRRLFRSPAARTKQAPPPARGGGAPGPRSPR